MSHSTNRRRSFLVLSRLQSRIIVQTTLLPLAALAILAIGITVLGRRLMAEADRAEVVLPSLQPLMKQRARFDGRPRGLCGDRVRPRRARRIPKVLYVASHRRLVVFVDGQRLDRRSRTGRRARRDHHRAEGPRRRVRPASHVPRQVVERSRACVRREIRARKRSGRT